MPAAFFQATDDDTNGVPRANGEFLAFMRRHNIPISPAILDRDDIDAAVSDIWLSLGGDIPSIRSDVIGPLNGQASDLEIALLTWFVLKDKFAQYIATLPGG